MDIKSLITIEELPTVGSTNPEQEYLLLQTPEKTGKMPLSNLPSEASKIGFDNKGTNLSSNTVQAAITELDSGLIDIYVGDDGKLHKVKGGADSVLPFNGVKYLGQFTRDPWYNENGFIIRDVYENYRNITIDNIIVFPVSLGCYFSDPHTTGGPYNIGFTYNNDTGVITDRMIGMANGQGMSIEVAKIYIIE